MTLTESATTDKKPEGKPQEKKEKPLTKVIIRRLPPNIDKETFLNQISPVPDYNYIYMVKGDSSLGENAFSRVYINFVCPEDVYNFKERFDNYVFLDQRGHEYPAVVEFAAFQKIPKKKGKVRIDPKCAKIETDPVYLEFLESLNKPEEPAEEKPEYTLQLNSENKNDMTTPLLEYIKNKYAQRLKIRENRREERKKRELERKKNFDERKKYNEEKSPHKNVMVKPSRSHSSLKEDKAETEHEKNEKPEGAEAVKEKPERTYEKSSYYKNKEKKYEDRKRDNKKYPPPKKDYADKREYKRNDDYKDRDYRTKYDSYKKESETKVFPKKVKKYSERREERKLEAKKAEQQKLEQQSKESNSITEIKAENIAESSSKPTTVESEDTKPKPIEKESNTTSEFTETASSSSSKHCERESKKESESAAQKRIRNKDRPTIAIYRPGMLSKRKQTEEDTENKEIKDTNSK